MCKIWFLWDTISFFFSENPFIYNSFDFTLPFKSPKKTPNILKRFTQESCVVSVIFDNLACFCLFCVYREILFSKSQPIIFTHINRQSVYHASFGPSSRIDVLSGNKLWPFEPQWPQTPPHTSFVFFSLCEICRQSDLRLKSGNADIYGYWRVKKTFIVNGSWIARIMCGSWWVWKPFKYL